MSTKCGLSMLPSRKVASLAKLLGTVPSSSQQSRGRLRHSRASPDDLCYQTIVSRLLVASLRKNKTKKQQQCSAMASPATMLSPLAGRRCRPEIEGAVFSLDVGQVCQSLGQEKYSLTVSDAKPCYSNSHFSFRQQAGVRGSRKRKSLSL